MKYKLPHSAKYFGLNSGVQLNLDTIQSQFQRTYSFNIYKSIGSFWDQNTTTLTNGKLFQQIMKSFSSEAWIGIDLDQQILTELQQWRWISWWLTTQFQIHTQKGYGIQFCWTVGQYSNQHLNSHQSLDKSDQNLQRSYNNNNLQMIS